MLKKTTQTFTSFPQTAVEENGKKSCAQGYCAPILLKCMSLRDKWLKMVAKRAGTEQSRLKHLNYKTTSTDCNKTAGQSCKKSASTEAMFTMKFIWKPESASQRKEKLKVGSKDAHQGELLTTFTGIWGLISLEPEFFSPIFLWWGCWKAAATDAFTLPLAAQTQLPFKQVHLEDEHICYSFVS